MVGTEQLRDASVTREKLGFELNPELPGSFVLEAGPHPPEGYRYTGAHLCAYYGDPKWPVLEQKEPSPGPAAAVAHRGHIYMLQVSGEFWRFNDRTGVWTRLENPYPPRSGFAMACAHGTIYVFGGLEDGKIAAVTRSYNLGTGEWRELGAMPCPRSGMAVAEHEGRIHLIGGEVRSLLGRKPSTVHATFNSATGKWSELEHLPKPRAYASAVVLRDRIHVVGGERAGFLGRAATAWHEEYHAASDQWIVREPLRVPATRLACGAIGGRIHAFGGEQPGLFARALIRAHQEYDPAMNWWLEKPPLPVACGGLSVVSDDNTLIAVGGRAHRREGLPMAYVLGSVFCVHRKF
jgi:N-acetylneuraminic acid mutarotase